MDITRILNVTMNSKVISEYIENNINGLYFNLKLVEDNQDL